MSNTRDLLSKYVPVTYINQGLDSTASHERYFEILLQHGKLPSHPWPEATIEFVINKISLMDSNNFPSNIGVGEREGRIFSSLVARRHYRLSHGIGRSGDIIEVQPKAAGSSLIYKLTNLMAKHALTLAGIVSEIDCIIFPLATGMTVAMSMMTLKATANDPAKKFVIWPRIDQKSCFKSIMAAGLEPIIVENVLDTAGGSMQTNLVEIGNLLRTRSHEILCVLSTTSCFAPRQPDLADEIAKLCKAYDVGHVVNNAYGLQCARITKLLTRACRVGRVDASKLEYAVLHLIRSETEIVCVVIQSTDKNFLVPVGGAVVASTSPSFLKALSSSYPGRASAAPILDLFITFLSMGESGYKDLLRSRSSALAPAILTAMQPILDKYGISSLPTVHNSISYAYCLDSLPSNVKGLTFLGSMLFQRNVSGCRVVTNASKVTKIAGYDFKTWGAHMNDYPHSYFTVACAIGMQMSEVDVFASRLDKAIGKFVKINTTGSALQETIAESSTVDNDGDET
eukprot:gene22274-27237_t